MKLNGKQDVDVAASFVARVLLDFPGWERAALRRGLDVRRTDGLAEPGIGSSWSVRFSFRGRQRVVDLTVVEREASGRVVLSFVGKAAQGTATLVPLALSPHRTRISASVDVQARTLAARLLFQSLRLARQRVVRRFDKRMALLGAEIEARFKAAGG